MPRGRDGRGEGMETECSRSSSAPVVDTCSHPTALLQRFHRITQKRHVRVTQFISLSSPFICSHRCTTGGSVSSRALVTSEERAPFFSVSHHPIGPFYKPFSLQAGQQLHMWLMIITVWQAGGGRETAAAACACTLCLRFYKICNQIYAQQSDSQFKYTVSATASYCSAVSTPSLPHPQR